MKSNLSKYTQEVISGFQANRGKASVYCFPPIDFAKVIHEVIVQFRDKSPEAPVFVAVDSYATRTAVTGILNKEGIDNVKVLSADYVNAKYKYDYKLVITVGVNDDIEVLSLLHSQAKFMLCILTKNIMDNSFISQLRGFLPTIDVTVSENAIRTDNIYSPVEETRIGIDLTTEERELYDKYSEYISTSVSIFGDISNIEKCRIGDNQNNIGASEFRDDLAKQNGWSTELDTTIEWSKQIDDVYNPNVLLERANNFYNITKQRRDLVTDTPIKLQKILSICLDNKDKKILIVSKRGEFASYITKVINEMTDIKCADYHDNIESAILLDEYGDTVLIKSGKDKGKPKVVGAIAISTLNMKRFNAPYKQNNPLTVNCLSIKNSSAVKLEIAVDIVIFTTPFIDDIIAFKTRFSNVHFNAAPTILYKIYCIGTIEQKHLLKQKETPLITVIDDSDNFIGYDETNSDYIL